MCPAAAPSCSYVTSYLPTWLRRALLLVCCGADRCQQVQCLAQDCFCLTYITQRPGGGQTTQNMTWSAYGVHQAACACRVLHTSPDTVHWKRFNWLMHPTPAVQQLLG
jgi:hypothetical protein